MPRMHFFAIRGKVIENSKNDVRMVYLPVIPLRQSRDTTKYLTVSNSFIVAYLDPGEVYQINPP